MKNVLLAASILIFATNAFAGRGTAAGVPNEFRNNDSIDVRVGQNPELRSFVPADLVWHPAGRGKQPPKNCVFNNAQTYCAVYTSPSTNTGWGIIYGASSDVRAVYKNENGILVLWAKCEPGLCTAVTPEAARFAQTHGATSARAGGTNPSQPVPMQASAVSNCANMVGTKKKVCEESQQQNARYAPQPQEQDCGNLSMLERATCELAKASQGAGGARRK